MSTYTLRGTAPGMTQVLEMDGLIIARNNWDEYLKTRDENTPIVYYFLPGVPDHVVEEVLQNTRGMPFASKWPRRR